MRKHWGNCNFWKDRNSEGRHPRVLATGGSFDFSIFDADEKPIALLSQWGLHFYWGAQRARASMFWKGEPALHLADKDGKLIWKAPELAKAAAREEAAQDWPYHRPAGEEVGATGTVTKSLACERRNTTGLRRDDWQALHRRPDDATIRKKRASQRSPTNAFWPSVLAARRVHQAQLKGILVGREPIDITKGSLPDWITKHNQVALLEKAQIELDGQLLDFIRRASMAVVWSGRYPVPKQRDDMDTRIGVSADRYLFRDVYEILDAALKHEIGRLEKRKLAPKGDG